MTKAYKLTIPSGRDERLQYMKRMFPQAAGTGLNDDWRGGRQAALKKLNSIDIEAYSKNRYFINGAVSKLSPYLRYGCLTLKESADNLQKRFGAKSEKVVQQLARRDYFRRVWYQQGDKIFNNLVFSKIPKKNLTFNRKSRLNKIWKKKRNKYKSKKLSLRSLL